MNEESILSGHYGFTLMGLGLIILLFLAYRDRKRTIERERKLRESGKVSPKSRPWL